MYHAQFSWPPQESRLTGSSFEAWAEVKAAAKKKEEATVKIEEKRILKVEIGIEGSWERIRESDLSFKRMWWRLVWGVNCKGGRAKNWLEERKRSWWGKKEERDITSSAREVAAATQIGTLVISHFPPPRLFDSLEKTLSTYYFKNIRNPSRRSSDAQQSSKLQSPSPAFHPPVNEPQNQTWAKAKLKNHWELI